MGFLNYNMTSALCEPIDNSIQSTNAFTDRVIQVRLNVDDAVSDCVLYLEVTSLRRYRLKITEQEWTLKI
jgi:hypothetical protein